MLATGARCRFIPEGHICSIASHLQICRAIVDQGLPHGLILEDDVILPGNIEATLREIPQMQDYGSVVLLPYYSHKSEPLVLTRREGKSLPTSGELLAPVEVNAVASAAAYVVSRAIAQRMLDTLCPVDHVADNWGLFFQKMLFSRLYCLYPSVVKDAPFVPLVEYSATRTPAARLKAALRGISVINRLAKLLRKEVIPDRHRISIMDASPFWLRNGKHRDAA